MTTHLQEIESLTHEVDRIIAKRNRVLGVTMAFLIVALIAEVAWGTLMVCGVIQ